MRLEKIFGDRLSDLKKLMQKLMCIISGSFVLQCMLDEEWKGSDIDFYVLIRGNKITKTSSEYYKSKLDDFMYKTMKFDGSARDTYDGHIDQNKMKWVRNYDKMIETKKRLRTTVQIIGIDADKSYESMYHFVNKTFDFKICKNMYYYDNGDHIRARDFVEVFSKTTEFAVSRGRKRDVRSSIDRRDKYISHGIKFAPITFKNVSHLRLSDHSVRFVFGNNANTNDIVYHFLGNAKMIRKIDEARLNAFRVLKCTQNCILAPFGESIIDFFGEDTEHYHYGDLDCQFGNHQVFVVFYQNDKKLVADNYFVKN